MSEPVEYMSAADIAALFPDTKPGTVEKWRQRYPSFPEEDAITGISHGQPIRGWLPERAEEFREWKRQTIRGPGRPRKTAVDGDR